MEAVGNTGQPAEGRDAESHEGLLRVSTEEVDQIIQKLTREKDQRE